MSHKLINTKGDVTMEKKKQKQLNLADLALISKPAFDIDKYVGTKVKIAMVSLKDSRYGTEEGRVEKYIVVETAKIGKTNITAKKFFNLSKDNNGKVGWSEKSKLAMLLSKMNVDSPQNLVGKEVTIIKNGESNFLTFE